MPENYVATMMRVSRADPSITDSSEMTRYYAQTPSWQQSALVSSLAEMHQKWVRCHLPVMGARLQKPGKLEQNIRSTIQFCCFLCHHDNRPSYTSNPLWTTQGTRTNH